MTAQEVFELLLVLGTVKHQPVSGGIADTIAESQVQPPSDLVDEIIHVAVEAAIVVTGKDHSPFIVEEYPAREVNGGDTRQMPAHKEVARRVVHQPEQEDQRPSPKHSWLDATHGTELIGHVDVFELR